LKDVVFVHLLSQDKFILRGSFVVPWTAPGTSVAAILASILCIVVPGMVWIRGNLGKQQRIKHTSQYMICILENIEEAVFVQQHCLIWPRSD
jgi:hypothetical protein